MTLVDYTTIEAILTILEVQYSSTITSADQTLPIAYSKLSVLELGGWIEESVDTILINYIDNKILSEECKNKTKEIINKNNSFEYGHLYHIFICALGVNNWENIIDNVGNPNIALFAATCNSYKRPRNSAAHTYQLASTTSNYQAPSQVIIDFRKIKPILQSIEREVLNLI